MECVKKRNKKFCKTLTLKIRVKKRKKRKKGDSDYKSSKRTRQTLWIVNGIQQIILIGHILLCQEGKERERGEKNEYKS